MQYTATVHDCAWYDKPHVVKYDFTGEATRPNCHGFEATAFTARDGSPLQVEWLEGNLGYPGSWLIFCTL